jgi:hypothetical protein
LGSCCFSALALSVQWRDGRGSLSVRSCQCRHR